MKYILECNVAVKGIHNLLMKNKRICSPIVQKLCRRSFHAASTIRKQKLEGRTNTTCCPLYVPKRDFSIDLGRYRVEMADDDISAQAERLFQKLNENHNLDEFESLDYRKQLASILYDLYIRQDLRFLLYFMKMHEYNILIEPAYRIMMRYLAEQNDLVNLDRVLNMLKEDKNVTILSRSYIPSIIASISNNDSKQAMKYLNDMFFVMGAHFKANNFVAIVQKCADVRTIENYDFITGFMDELCRLIQGFGGNQLEQTLIEAMTEWFEKDPKFKWHIEKTPLSQWQSSPGDLTTPVFKTDQNSPLNENLQLYIKASLIRCIKKMKNLKAERKLIMNRYYQEMVSDAILKSSSMTDVLDNEIENNNELLERHLSFRTLTKLDTLLALNGPFHLVVDTLNIINNIKFVLNKNRLSDTEIYVEFKDIIDVFIQQRKHILIIWPHFLKAKYTNAMKNENADSALRSVFAYLEQHCNLFFADSSLTDDFFILYTLQHSNFKTQLLSCDNLRDHINFLDVENRIQFLHWQRENQFFVESKVKGRFPVLNTSGGGGGHPAVHFGDGKWRFVGEDSVYSVSPLLKKEKESANILFVFFSM